MRPRHALYLAQVGGLALVYLGAAKLGLAMAFLAEQVTPVWPPTGIALAALLLRGPRLWPGVALGAFLANLTTPHETALTACGIAAGNTLEAVVGAGLLHCLVGPRPLFGRLKDVVGFVVLAALLSTAVCATAGVASLCWGGVHPWSAFGSLWKVWWLGDVMGNLVVAPLLLTWAGRPPGLVSWRRIAEGGTLLLALTAVCLIVFDGQLAAVTTHHPLEYTVFPFVIWAALRFGPPLTTLATFLACGIAVAGTRSGFGPFTGGTVHENLVLLQTFLGVVAATALALSAATAERRQAERAVRESHATLRAVVEGTTDAVFVKDLHGRYLMINAAGARLLGRSVAEVIGKDDGELFSPDTARRIMADDRRTMKGGAVRTYEEQGTAAGVTRTYLSTKGPYQDAQGNVLGLIGISRDISERKQAEEEAAKQRLARQIQQSLFPAAPPRVPGLDVGGASYPADATGGDYFDYLLLPCGGLGLVIGDASGHGIGPALMMAATRAYLRALALTRADLGAILALLNRALAGDLATEHFVTLLFARLDPATRSCAYASAGHSAGYVLDRSGAVRCRLESTGLPLGVSPDATFPTRTGIALQPGDLLLLLTDGILEARSPDGEAFGVQRALDVIRVYRADSARQIAVNLYHAVRAFTQETPQQDDITAVVVKVD
jgi:PAS domain S-box-containing protein